MFADFTKDPKSRIFMWGQACYGALGNPNVIYRPQTNVRIIKQSIFKYFHSITVWIVISETSSTPAGHSYCLQSNGKVQSERFGMWLRVHYFCC